MISIQEKQKYDQVSNVALAASTTFVLAKRERRKQSVSDSPVQNDQVSATLGELRDKATLKRTIAFLDSAIDGFHLSGRGNAPIRESAFMRNALPINTFGRVLDVWCSVEWAKAGYHKPSDKEMFDRLALYKECINDNECSDELFSEVKCFFKVLSHKRY